MITTHFLHVICQTKHITHVISIKNLQHLFRFKSMSLESKVMSWQAAKIVLSYPQLDFIISSTLINIFYVTFSHYFSSTVHLKTSIFKKMNYILKNSTSGQKLYKKVRLKYHYISSMLHSQLYYALTMLDRVLNHTQRLSITNHSLSQSIHQTIDKIF